MIIASVIMEEAERVAKNRISTADGHYVNYEQLYSREMQKEPWKEKKNQSIDRCFSCQWTGRKRREK